MDGEQDDKTTPLRLLIAGASGDDTETLLATLRDGGFDPQFRQVESAGAMRGALADNLWDAVICDYTLPRFDAFEALGVVRESGVDLPIIVVSGRTGEESAIDLMQAGAHDIIVKDNLRRLAPALAREIAAAETRRQHTLAQALLLESEARFRILAEASPVGIFQTDANGRCIYVNERWLEMTGIPSAEALEKGWECAIHPDDRASVIAERDRCMAENRPFAMEFRFRRPDGDIVGVLGRIEGQAGDSGQVVTYVGTVTDITQLKETQLQLTERVKEERCLFLVASLAATPDLPEETLLREALPLIAAGFQFPDITGVRIRLDGREFSSDNFRKTPWMLAADLAIGGAAAGCIEVCYLQERPTAAEGPFLAEERELLDTLRHILGRAIDSRRSAAALSTSEHHLREAQHIARLGSWTWDIDSNTVTWTRELYHIIGRDPALPAPTVEEQQLLYTPESWDRLSAALDQCVSLGEPFELDVEVPRPQGSRWFTARGHAHRDEQGNLIRLHGTAMDISERKRAELAVEASERRFRALTENASDLIVIIDADGIIAYTSPSLARLGGYGAVDVHGRNFLDFLHPEDRAAGREAMEKVLAQPDVPVVSELRFHHRDGHFVVLESASKNVLADPAVAGIVVNARDITERKRAETELLSLNRILRTLSACNQALVRASDETELLQTLCDIIVADAGYKMAWIGYAAPGQTVRVVASSGEGAAEYLADVHITWDDSPHGKGPTGEALRKRAPAVTDDIGTDPRFAPWREEAKQQGYRSSAALPLQAPDGELLGVLSIYSPQPHAFGKEALALLQELAGDLGFGIRTLRDGERLRLANAVVESSPTILFRWGAGDGWPVEYVSDNIRQFGYEAADFVNGVIDYAKIIHPDDTGRIADEVSRYTTEDAAEFTQEYRIVTRSGAVRWVEDHTSVQRDTNGRVAHYQGTLTDITERKLQAIRIAHLSRIRAVLSAINGMIVRVHERQELFDDACRIAITQGGFTMAWIGWLDTASGEIKPVARAGTGVEDYLSDLVFNIGPESPGGQTRPAHALRSRKPAIHNDLETDTAFVNRDRALAHGLRSAGIFPLLVNGEAQGVLALYSGETGFFDADELNLLEEMAADIGFAVNHIAQEQQVNYLALYDSLTGLANRVHFHERADDMLREAARHRHGAAMVLVDVEHFRNINDSLGRHTGDALLKNIAERLRRVAGEQALIARAEADRYALLVNAVTAPAEIAHFIDGIVTGCFDAPFTLEGGDMLVSARFGIALSPADGDRAEALYNNAEAALIRAKLSSERYLFYEPGMNARIASQLAMENRLRNAVRENQFVLYYQPRVSSRTRAIAGLEALIRWDDPEAGLVLPGDFIPLLEDTGLILPVGNWVLEQARRDRQAWQGAGLAVPPIAVNLSAIQLRRADFVDSILKVIDGDTDHGLDLEVTESLLMESIEDSREKLQRLRQAGFRIAVDDFGTGYSSLTYIARLPLDFLKIDRSFIAKLAQSAQDMAIVESIIALGHNLDLKIVAEGVETEEQAKLLGLLRCDEMQGYLFARPMPAADVAALLDGGDGQDQPE